MSDVILLTGGNGFSPKSKVFEMTDLEKQNLSKWKGLNKRLMTNENLLEDFENGGNN